MFWLKKCPRCRGDLISESDVHGTFVSCLQCGHMRSAAAEASLRGSVPPGAAKAGESSRAGAA